MFGTEFLKCKDAVARRIEFDLLRRIWMAENVPDDHIVWPTITIGAPAVQERSWGVNIKWRHAHEKLGANAYDPPFSDSIDVSRLSKPLIEFDKRTVDESVEKAHEFTGGKLQVHVHYRHMGYAPFDVATSMRGMENLLMDTVVAPEKVTSLMEFLTNAEIEHEKRREANGWLNVHADPSNTFQQVGFRVHCAYLAEDFTTRAPRLEDEWTYLSQQTSAGLGPDQYGEFVQPYNDALASMFPQMTVYYHGCECLDEKLELLSRTPNLRRFHVSPWSSLERARDKFQGSVVLEVHDHPGKVFFGASKDETRKGLRDLIVQAAGHPMDLNISDIHSFDGKPELLTQWAQLAQEEVS